MSSSLGLTVLLNVGYRAAVMELSAGGAGRDSELAGIILMSLATQSGIAQGELGGALLRDPMTMSQAVKGLRRRGLVSSQPDPADRRSMRLSLTRKGRTLVQSLAAQEARIVQQLTKEWGKQRANQFLADLQAFGELLTHER